MSILSLHDTTISRKNKEFCTLCLFQIQFRIFSFTLLSRITLRLYTYSTCTCICINVIAITTQIFPQKQRSFHVLLPFEAME